MATPENIPQSVNNPEDKIVPLRRRSGKGGPPAKHIRESERKIHLEVFGSQKQRRSAEREATFPERRAEFQFRRAYEHLLNGNESLDDLRYAIARASRYLPELSNEEFDERLSHIREGRYNNGDVLAVSNHCFLQGDFESGSAIRSFFYEEKQPKNSPLPPSTVPDAIDISIQNGFGMSTGDIL